MKFTLVVFVGLGLVVLTCTTSTAIVPTNSTVENGYSISTSVIPTGTSSSEVPGTEGRSVINPDNAEKLKLLGTIDTMGAMGFAWSPDGKMLAVDSQKKKKITLYDTGTFSEIRSIDNTHWCGNFEKLSFGLDGTLLSCEGIVWDLGNHDNGIEIKRGANAFSPDGKTLAVFGRDEDPPYKDRIYLYNTADFTIEPRVGESGNINFNKIAFSPDGTKLAGVGISDDGSGIELWDVEQGKLLLYHQTDYAEDVAWNVDGTLLASVGAILDDSGIQLWDSSTLEPKSKIVSNEGVFGSYDRLAFNPDGSILIGANEFLGSIGIYNFTKQEEITTIGNVGYVFGTSLQITAIAFSPDGFMLTASTCNLGGGKDTGGILFWGIGAPIPTKQLLPSWTPLITPTPFSGL
jgi:WD40 repeat protein